jgi:hypothetical protein
LIPNGSGSGWPLNQTTDTLGELRAAHQAVTELLARIERRVAHVETSQERQFRMAEEVVRRWENERPPRFPPLLKSGFEGGQ